MDPDDIDFIVSMVAALTPMARGAGLNQVAHFSQDGADDD